MSEEYDRHLASLHDVWATPPTVVEALAADVAGSAVVDIRRIVHGEQNEVYDVTLAGAPSLIVRISHDGADAFEREMWVLGQCEARRVRVPRVHGLRHVEVDGESLAAIVMDKIDGDRLCDVDLGEADLRRVLGEVGAWLTELHAIPIGGFGYLDGTGVGKTATFEDWLTDLTGASAAFEEAGRSVRLPATTVRSWLSEIAAALRAAPPRVGLIHNDLLSGHVIVRHGALAGIIDFGEVAAEPIANDFAKWDFVEGERFPVEWLRDGYRRGSLLQPPKDPTYRALWLANGLWRLRWYHETGYPPGAAAARDRLLSESSL